MLDVNQGCLFYFGDMRHRRVGRFRCRNFFTFRAGKLASLGAKILSKGWRFSFPTRRALGLTSLSCKECPSPATKGLS